MHPNDTLNGRLLAYEVPEERHLRRKLGYWHMVEERMVRAELVAEGKDPQAVDFWHLLSERIMANHRDDVSFKVSGMIRQQVAAERDHMVETATDECVQALRDIRDGYNDPRQLAADVLAKLETIR